MSIANLIAWLREKYLGRHPKFVDIGHRAINNANVTIINDLIYPLRGTDKLILTAVREHGDLAVASAMFEYRWVVGNERLYLSNGVYVTITAVSRVSGDAALGVQGSGLSGEATAQLWRLQ